MSWKAVELQVALPRTQDAGKLQEQLQQRGQAAQDRMAAEGEKEQEKLRTQAPGSAESEQTRLQSGDKERFPVREGRLSHPAGMEEGENRLNHPFKGRLIDITG